MNPKILGIIAQMLIKGRVYKEELYQLENYIPGSICLLSDMLKISSKQLFDKMQEGKVLTNDVLVPFLNNIQSYLESNDIR